MPFHSPAIARFFLAFACLWLAALPSSSLSPQTSWAVYLYLCGSDLETDNGAASRDLIEALHTKLPPGVEFIVQTGGAKAWQTKILVPGKMHRLRHTGDDLIIVESVPNANMGDPETLSDFLRFCHENYPAERAMLILWNHGGGSAGGICYDEQYDDDDLSFGELQAAFEGLYGSKPERKPFEIIGFDACLMATVDMAGLSAPFANYLVASQNLEPSCGWKFDGFLAALAENPSMDGRELGRVLCDTYYEGCENVGAEGEATLSLIDLSKMDNLSLALSLVGYEGMSSLLNDTGKFYAELGRGKARVGAYYYGMIDLHSLVKTKSRLFPMFSKTLLDAVKDAVVYQAAGPYSQTANGLSVFYPTPDDAAAYGRYGEAANAGRMRAPYYLFEPLMTGSVSPEAERFWEKFAGHVDALATKEGPDGPAVTPMSSGGAAAPGPMPSLVDTSGMGYASHPVSLVDAEGETSAMLMLEPEKAQYLQRVGFLLGRLDPDTREVRFLGESATTREDWERGVFTDGFRGVWGGINGHYVAMRVASVTDDYILYEVPLKIDGKRHSLMIASAEAEAEYKILTARLDASETGGIPSRRERLLIRGDEITTLLYKMDEDAQTMRLVENETFVLEETPAFAELPLPDGVYALLFSMTDYRERMYYSVPVFATLEDGRSELLDAEAFHARLSQEGEYTGVR